MRIFPVDLPADETKWIGWATQRCRALYENAKTPQFKYVMPAPTVLCKLGRDTAGLYAYVIHLGVPYYPSLALANMMAETRLHPQAVVRGLGPNTNFQTTALPSNENSTVASFYYRGDAAQRSGHTLIASDSGSLGRVGNNIVAVNWPLTSDQFRFISLLGTPASPSDDQWDVFNGTVTPAGNFWGPFQGARSPGAAGSLRDAIAWERENNGKGERFAAGVLPEDWDALLKLRHPLSTDAAEVSPVEGETARITLFGPDGKTSLDDWNRGADVKIHVFGSVTCAYSAGAASYVFKGWKPLAAADILRIGRRVRVIGGHPALVKIVYENGTPLKIVTTLGDTINPVYSDGSPVNILSNSGEFVTVITIGAPNTPVGDFIYGFPFHSYDGLWVTADNDGNLLWFDNYPTTNVLLEYGGMRYESLVTLTADKNRALLADTTTLPQDDQLMKQVRSLM